MAEQSPTLDDLLREIQLTTPDEYWRKFFEDPEGGIATYRGAARALLEYAKVAGRSASRQFFLRPPGFEPAGPGVRASQLVTFGRASGEDSGLFLEAGTVFTEGPRQRFYKTVEDIQWVPFDPNPTRTVELQSTVIGEPGNLDYLADDDGNLTLPEDPTLPGIDVVDLQDRSQGRSDIKAVLTLGPATLTDNGLAPTFSPSDPGLYLRINQAGDAANIGRVLRIIGYGVSTVEDPPGSGRFTRFVILDDGPQPNLVESAQADDGGVFTDYTATARAASPSGIALLPVAPVVNDAFYFGGPEPFSQIDIDVQQKRVGDLDLTWEYWDGVAWVAFLAVELVDGTEAFSIEGVRPVTITPPAGWASTTVNGVPAFYVRARVSAFVSQSQQPLAGRLLIYYGDPLQPDPLDPNGDGQISWTILDAKDLGVVIESMTAPAGGRDDDLGLKLRERGIQRMPGESEDQLRRRASRFDDVVSPELLERKILRILEPYGLTAEICDVGYDGPGAPNFSGLFWDVDPQFAPGVVGAWDLYGPGDAFPVNDSFLPLSINEARWHFFVCVPPPTLGEFGAAWDDGPPAYFEASFGTFLGSAWDFAFVDGYAALSSALYMEVYDCLKSAKGGGIGYTLIQKDLVGCP